MWALPCGIVEWKNDVHLSFKSLSDLQIDEQQGIWFLALGYFIETLRLDGMQLV